MRFAASAAAAILLIAAANLADRHFLDMWQFQEHHIAPSPTDSVLQAYPRLSARAASRPATGTSPATLGRLRRLERLWDADCPPHKNPSAEPLPQSRIFREEAGNRFEAALTNVIPKRGTV